MQRNQIQNGTSKVLKTLEGWIIKFIQDRDLVVLRDRNGMAINVSYTEDGLKWTMQGNKLIYYKDAYLKYQKMGKLWLPYIDGDQSQSNRYYVEKFVPTDQNTGYLQKYEFRAVDKALKLLYNVE